MILLVECSIANVNITITVREFANNYTEFAFEESDAKTQLV